MVAWLDWSLLGASLALFLPVSPVSAAVAPNASIPRVDFAALGLVGLAGNFRGLQQYDAAYESSLEALNVSSSATTLWSRSKDGQLFPLGSTDPGANISAVCQHGPLVYVGGNFTTMGATPAARIASFDPSSARFTALGPGLDGPVLSLYCGTDALLAGGAFTGPVGASRGYQGGVASWSYSDQAWSPVSFGGLQGDVRAITSNSGSNSASTFYGGSFSLTVSNGTSTATGSSNNTTIASLGSSLAPIPLSQSYTWAGPTLSGDPYQTFCPDGNGTTGSAWLTPDGQAGIFVVRLYVPLQAGGLRIGNTFQDGRGTRQFKVVSIPDSIVQTLTYNSDPSDPTSTLTTCDWECPLSNNASIPYQDFLFPEGTNITGFQIDVDAWYGSGGGFHQISLLSNGAYAYANNTLNGDETTTCSSGVAAGTLASSSQSGSWSQRSVPSSIENVDATVLTASVPVGSDASSSPSITFTPAIVANGGYDAYLFTPGCQNMNDCAARTSVDVVVNPGNGATTTTTVSQRNNQDASTLVYSGALQAGATFQVRLAADPSGSGSDGNYELVAQEIQLVAQNTNARLNRPASAGKGFYEAVPSGSSGSFGDGAAATASTSSSTFTVNNATGFDELSTYFTNTSNVINALLYADNAVFYGGAFNAVGNLTSSNVGVYAGPTSTRRAPNGGLNAPVTSLLDVNGWLYAAGTFTATADASVRGLGGVARWQYSSDDTNWEALTGGNVPTFSAGALGLAVGQSGGNTAVLVSGSNAGFSVYDTQDNTWDSAGSSFFVGSLSTLESADENSPAYLAGSIAAAMQHRASGIARLVTNSSGQTSIVPYNFDFADAAATTARSTKRSFRLASLMPRMLLGKRASPAASTDLPSAIDSDAANQILAGAFYKNGSDYSVLLGGRYTSGNCTNIGSYSTDQNTLNSLNDSLTIDGVVRALKIVDDTLYIGGTFTTSSSSAMGFATYDLQNNAWTGTPPALTPYDGEDLTIHSIVARPDGTIIVGGVFAAAGSLSCPSVCLWNPKKSQWNALGSGLSGVVSSLDLAGDDDHYLLAAGNFAVNGQTASVAQWDFKNNRWSLLGAPNALPGPATALSADDANENNVFVAGGSTATQSVPYLMRWNGSAWSDLSDGSLEAGSRIQQLAFLPLDRNHDKNSVIESDRLLMISGALSLGSVGSVSSALFDGVNYMPFISTATESGAPGAVASLFYSSSTFRLAKKYLSTGIVILISIAIGLGLVFLLVLIGLIFAVRSRKSENEQQQQQQPRPPSGIYADQSEKSKHRPTSLLATLNAATALIAVDGSKSIARHQYDSSSSISADHDGYVNAGGLPDGASPEPFPEGLVTTRYSFDAEAPGELSVGAGETLRVLDRSDSQWIFCEKEDGSARGVLPLSYCF